MAFDNRSYLQFPPVSLMHNNMEQCKNIQEHHFCECAEIIKPIGHIHSFQGRMLFCIWKVILTDWCGGKLKRVVEDRSVVPLKNQLIENMHVMRVLLMTSMAHVRLAGE